MPNIRLAVLQDSLKLAPIFDAYRQFYHQPTDVVLAEHFLQQRMRHNQSIIFIAEDSTAKILGFCQLYPSFCSLEAQPIYILSDLFVLPDYRNSGMAKQLMQQAEGYAMEQGCVRLELTTAKTNTPAQTLYAAQGWCKDKIFDAYHKVI